MPDFLAMKGSKGRDASPKTTQRPLMGPTALAKAPPGAELTGVGTPIGGKPPEASSSGGSQGVISPAIFNVDGHALRQFSRYLEGKRAGPDWLHKRTEDAERARFEEGLKLARRS